MPSTSLTPEIVHRHFPQFTEPGLQAELAELGEVRRLEAGELLIDFGAFVRMVPLVIEGSIKVSREAEDGSELFLYYLTRGDSCTMTFSCCLHNKRSAIRAVAEETTTLIALPRRVFDDWIMRYKSWKNFILQTYDTRLYALIDTIDQVTFYQLNERLEDYLHTRAALYPDRKVPATHLEIANDLHVSREAVSRTLKGLERRGMIELGRGWVAVRI